MMADGRWNADDGGRTTEDGEWPAERIDALTRIATTGGGPQCRANKSRPHLRRPAVKEAATEAAQRFALAFGGAENVERIQSSRSCFSK